MCNIHILCVLFIVCAVCVLYVCVYVCVCFNSVCVSDSSGSLRGINREQSVEVIHLDVSRTFPTLGFFQEVRT